MDTNYFLTDDVSHSDMPKSKYNLENAEAFTRKICASLVKDSQEFNDTADTVYNDISTYCNNNGRLLYSTITQFIYEISLKDNEHNELTGNMTTNVSNLLNSHNDKNIVRLWDHINLAVCQTKSLKETDEDFDKKFQKRSPEILEKMDKKCSENQTQLISLVAIFTALSFLVFGDLTALQSIFSNINNACLSKIIILALLWGICTFNTITLFIYFICKVSGKGFICKDEDKVTYFEKYPIVVIGNYILCSLLACSLWYYFYVYVLNKSIDIKGSFYIGFTVILTLVLLVGIFIFVYKPKSRSEK